MRTEKFLVALFLVVICAANAIGQDRVPWQNDIRVAQQVASQRGQLVLVHFYGDNCPPCVWLEHHVFNRPEVIRALSTGYVPVRVNCDQLSDVADKFKIESMPTDVIITADGRELNRYNGAQPANKYIAYLDSVAAGYRAGQNGAIAGATPNPRNMPPSGNIRPDTNMNSGQFANQTVSYGNGPQADRAQTANWSNGGSQVVVGNNGFAGINGADSTARRDPNSNQPPNAAEGRYSNPFKNVSDPGQNASGDFVPSGSSGTPTINDTFHPTGQPQNAVANESPVQNSASGSNPSLNGPTYETGLPPGVPPLMMEGYCPVSLIQGESWQKGDTRFGAIHRGRTYLFASESEREVFLASPDKFAPALAGFDAVRFAETGQLVEGKPDHGSMFENRIYLFTDVRAQERFERNPAPYAKRVRDAEVQNDPGQSR